MKVRAEFHKMKSIIKSLNDIYLLCDDNGDVQ